MSGKKHVTGYLIFSSVLLALFLGICFSIYNSWTNTLYNNQQWKSSKVGLEKGVMGAHAFMLSHTALAGGELNLAAWHGHQEVFLQRELDIKQLALDFRLGSGAYFYLFFSQNQDTLTGLRISQNPRFPNLVVKSYKGKFIEKKELEAFPLQSRNYLEITFGEYSASFSLNGTAYAKVLTDPYSANKLGFRGGASNSYIDNISLYDELSQQTITEDFGHQQPLLLQLLLGGLLIACFSGLLIAFPSIRNGLSAGLIPVTLISILLGVYYVSSFQFNYPASWMINWHGYKTNIGSAKELQTSIQELIQSNETDCCRKVMFIGSSQTWGAGASTEQHTFVSLFERILNKQAGADSFICINTGISGAYSKFLIESYKNHWIQLKPDFVILDLSSNDPDPEIFKKNLADFIKLNKQQRIKIYFILEANFSDRKALLSNHKVMRNLAERHGIQVIDMHHELLQHDDDGFLFWDFVHLTDFGQQLFAEILFQHLHKQIR